MKIELFVKSIFQEFPDKNGKGWPEKAGCPCQGGGICMPYVDEKRKLICNVFLRSEDFGGLMFDPYSTAVYKLDQEAYRTIESFQNHPELLALGMKDISSRLRIGANDLEYLIGALKKASLWQ